MEKVVINTAFVENPSLVSQIAEVFGSQSVVVSIDGRRRRLLGGYRVSSRGGRVRLRLDPAAAALQAVEAGAGEILINSIDRDGTQTGYDIELTRSVADAVEVPVISCGGAAGTADFLAAVTQGHASAVAVGALFVFKGPYRAVLVSYPDDEELSREVYSRL